MKQFNWTKGIDIQLVAPHTYQQNAAKRALRTWKNHFAAGMSSTDNNFPLHLWFYLRCYTMIQVTNILNMLRPSWHHPHLSAYTILYGVFDFNQKPMAPPSTKMQVHQKPQQQLTWDPHTQNGWYIGASKEHYWCYKMYISGIWGECNSNTVELFPKKPAQHKTFYKYSTIHHLPSHTNLLAKHNWKPSNNYKTSTVPQEMYPQLQHQTLLYLQGYNPINPFP